MGRQETINQLKDLLLKINDVELAETALINAKREYQNAKSTKSTRLHDFDKTHKKNILIQ